MSFTPDLLRLAADYESEPLPGDVLAELDEIVAAADRLPGEVLARRPRTLPG